MSKLTLVDLGTTLSNSAASTINANNNLIEVALENTLSRDGTAPNQMNSDLDMNHNDILNAGVVNTSSLLINGVLTTPATAVNASNFATAAQGIKADSAVQPAGLAATAATLQPLDTDLTAIGALVSAADTVPYATGSGTWSLAAFTAAARTFLAATTAALQRTALGLTGAATAAASVGTTWTPVLNFGGATTGITYATQTARYARIGSLVFVSINITLTSKGSAVGAATITGLPVTAENITGQSQALQFVAIGNLTSITTPVANVAPGASTISLILINAGGSSNQADTNYANNSSIILSGVINTGSLT